MTDAPPSTDSPTDAAPATPQTTPAGSSDSNGGFPEGTPLAEMTDAQKAAYWQHYARKHEDSVKAFKGLTPQQVADLQAENEALKTEKLSADEKAMKAVRDEAFKQARAQAEAEYLPQIRAAEVSRIASNIVSGDRLSAFMDLVDTTKLLDEKGQVSEEKVMGYLTAMYGTESPQASAGPRWQNFGQHQPPPPPQPAGAGGRAEAQKRFGNRT